jgi:chromosome segregation ATPase
MEKKTVGEILKERGIIKERPKEEEAEKKYKFEEEVSLKEIVMKIEKLGAEVIALKDVKFQADERIRELSEKIGELRSLMFQRETLIKEMESKVRVLGDSVSEIEPTKIMKEMEKRKVEMENLDMKMEKLQLTNREVMKSLENVKGVTDNIRSVENLTQTLKKIDEMVEKGDKARSDVDRLSAKTERFYIEMENRAKEFPEFKIKLEKVDDLTKEITKTVDEINIKLANFVQKDNFEIFKKSLDRMFASNKEEINERLKDIEEVLKVPGEEILNRKNNLMSKRENIFKLLANLEEQNRKGEITRNAYNEIKVKNESLLKKLDEEIKKMEGEESFSIKTLPRIINELESGLSMLEQKSDEVDSRMRVIEGEGIETTIRTQTEVSKNILEKLKEVNQKVSTASEKISECELKMNFFEFLNMIARAETSSDVLSNMSDLEKTVDEMKSRNIWDKKKENLVKNTLAEMGEAWRDYGYDDIAKIFADALVKIIPSLAKEVSDGPPKEYLDADKVQDWANER